MSSKMLIDASHPEETRVVVLKGNRVEEFDFESASKKQLRGNIYLAKVTRVEPSLQAAFVDYGGNRHGFLAFSEIHPDYYQIPYADRQALIEEEARAHRDEEDEGGRNGNGGGHRRSRRHRRDRDHSSSAYDRRGPREDRVSEPLPEDAEGESAGFAAAPEILDAEILAVDVQTAAPGSDDTSPLAAEGHAGGVPVDAAQSEAPASGAAADETAAEAFAPADAEAPHAADLESDEAGAAQTAVEMRDMVEDLPAEDAGTDEAGEDEADEEIEDGAGEDDEAEPPDESGSRRPRSRRTSGDGEEGGEDAEEEVVEQIGGDALEETSHRVARPRRHYKIQEVIKRRQILLIQVVKEERGNKGAALTTYLSLAGRYSVLMPNTARGGGISRKITDAEDRKRLKAIAQELEVPEGMGVILRTAGAARSKMEVKRDFEYLLRMWESVRELTLRSTAPTLVYEEGSLIKRAIRDLYTKDVEDIIVSGEEGFEEAREFMRMLMPTHVKNVQLYRESQPIFAKAGAEAQLDAMFSNHVTLRSGGYLVINQTEALVAIDVNSGRSTREHNIEDTALRTNLEAADEIARQLRLRDLAGLIVVDFIDMEESRNNRSVERRLKDALKNDRARIQIGRISHFGLLEMSRQRIRTGVLEGSTVVCPHCAGAGTVRSTSSIALHVLRLLEDALIKDASHNLIVRTRSEVALYILNQKRSHLIDLETRFGVTITVTEDASLTGMIYHAIERGEIARPVPSASPRPGLVRVDSVAPIYDEEDAEEDEGEGEAEGNGEGQGDRELAGGEASGEPQRRRKRRRRRRGRDRDFAGEVSADAPQPSDDGLAAAARIGGDLTEGARPEASFETEDEGDTFEAAFVASDEAPEDEVTARAPEPAPVEPAAPPSPEADAGGREAETRPATEEVEAEEPRRRKRSRRSAARSEDEAEATETPDADGEEDGVVAPRRRSRASRSRAVEAPEPRAVSPEMPLFAAPPTASSPAPVATPTPESAAEAVPERPTPSGSEPASPEAPVAEASAQIADAAPAGPEPGPAAEAEPADSAETLPPVEAEPEPARPKRTGWWQRAKATFGS